MASARHGHVGETSDLFCGRFSVHL
jgi:hypothetical protein